MNFDYQLHQAVSDYHFLAPFALSGSRGQTPKTLRYRGRLGGSDAISETVHRFDCDLHTE